MKKNRFKQKNIKGIFKNIKGELSFSHLLFIKNSTIVSKILRQKSSLDLGRMSSFFYTKIFSYCVVTGRARFTISKMNLSRHQFKSYLELGFCPGYFLPSW